MLLHHALAVDDVLDEIFKRLTYHNTSIINVNHQTQLVRRDLLAIALCCKTWKDKGLNLLWNRMSSLAPLLSLLPRMQRIDGKMAIIGKLDRAAFVVFDSYARRVVHLSFDTSDLHELDRATCINLSSLKGGLLPSLKTFRMCSGSRTSAFDQHTAILLLPALVRSKSLYSITRVDGHEGYGLGPTLSVLVNNVNTTTLYELSVHGKLPREYVSLFPTMHHLRSITIVLSTEGWEFELLETLSTLQTLQSLDISFHPSRATPLQSVREIPFDNLSSLSLTATLELILQILDSLGGAQLESLTLYPRGGLPGSPAEYRHLYGSMGKLPLLREVAQTFSQMDHASPFEEHSAKEVLRPMQALVRLESLRLWHIPPWLQFSDDDISTLAPAWPSLKKLILYRYVPVTVKPTMASLCHLAAACPELIQLLLSTDTAGLPSFSPKVVSSHSLQELTLLQVTTIDDPVIFARFIDGLFPNLLKLHMPAMSDKAIHDQTCDIIFKACQPVRRDERGRKRVYPHGEGKFASLSIIF